MKRIKVTTLRAIAIGFLAVFIMLLVIIPAFSNGTKESTEPVDVNPSFAPVQYAYPEFFEDQELSSGFSWRINEQAAVEVKDDEGSRYQVMPDGSIYMVNSDGSLSEVNDGGKISQILAAAEEAAAENDTVKAYFDNGDGIGELSDEEIAALIGSDIDPDDFRELQNAGLMPDEIVNYINQGYSLDDLLDLLNRGVKAEDLPDVIEEDQALRDRLEETLAGTGLTVDDLLDYLESIGMTPEQWLEAFRNASSAVQDGSSVPSIAVSPVTLSDLPPLTVNLGGSESAAEKREEEYLSYLDSISPVTDPTALASAIAGINTTTSDYVAQNDQAGKTEFMNSFSGQTGYDQLTSNDIAPGTVVTMILKTGINSDLPGQIVAEVTQNVFDSLTGRNLLIPKGTRLIATYSSSVSWGQERALVAWTQLIRPDGLVLNLPGLPGIDGQGYAGYRDKVDNHIWDLIWGAGLASLLEVGVNEINYIAGDSGYDALSEILGLYTDDLGSAAQEWLKNVINQQPTLTIRPGRTIKLLVTQKLTLTPYRGN